MSEALLREKMHEAWNKACEEADWYEKVGYPNQNRKKALHALREDVIEAVCHYYRLHPRIYAVFTGGELFDETGEKLITALHQHVRWAGDVVDVVNVYEPYLQDLPLYTRGAAYPDCRVHLKTLSSYSGAHFELFSNYPRWDAKKGRIEYAVQDETKRFRAYIHGRAFAFPTAVDNRGRLDWRLRRGMAQAWPEQVREEYAKILACVEESGFDVEESVRCATLASRPLLLMLPNRHFPNLCILDTGMAVYFGLRGIGFIPYRCYDFLQYSGLDLLCLPRTHVSCSLPSGRYTDGLTYVFENYSEDVRDYYKKAIKGYLGGAVERAFSFLENKKEVQAMRRYLVSYAQGKIRRERVELLIAYAKLAGAAA